MFVRFRELNNDLDWLPKVLMFYSPVVVKDVHTDKVCIFLFSGSVLG